MTTTDGFRDITDDEWDQIQPPVFSGGPMGCICGQLIGANEYIMLFADEEADCPKCGRVYRVMIQVKEA